MALQITITDAGRAEVINAANNGTAPVLISAIGIGTGKYIPDPAQTTLQTETKQLLTIAGQAVSSDTIHVTIKDETSDVYDVSEIGLYTDSGTLFAVYSDPNNAFMQKTAQSALMLSVDIILGTLDATNLTFGDTSFSNPPASTAVSGVLKLSDSTQAINGTDDTTAMTPIKVHKAFNQFGLGGNSASVADIDLLNKTGFYITTSNTLGVFPLAGKAGSLLHIERGSSNQATQFLDLLTGFGSPDQYTRTKHSDDTWSDWVLIANSGNMSCSLAANGYQKLPSGLIFQWGFGQAGQAGTSLATTFPVAFPNLGLTAIAIHVGGGETVNTIVNSLGQTSVVFENTTAQNVSIYWFAIGY